MKNICFQMTRKAWLTLVLVLTMAFPALAQKITVNGTVFEPEGEPAIGASVEVQGAQMGVATDIDGNFQLQVAPDAVLTISYVGCDTQTIPVEGRTRITVRLKTNTVAMNELVVVGYGAVKKSDATGSVAVIKPDEIEAGIAKSAQDLLVGASPGVVVTPDGGNPVGGATIRIRGGSSLSATNDPLIVIDGVPMTNQSGAAGTNPMTSINPQNIESMTILKDASATAIYGSRASNGVIIITTKRGKSGRPQVNFAANVHVATARKTLNVMDAAEFTDFVTNRVGTPAAIGMLGKGSTDWQKEVLRTAISHDYDLSVGGTVGFLPYRVSASYTNNKGIVVKSDLQRATVGINLSPKFFDEKLSVNLNVNGSYIKSEEADLGAVGAATSFNPTLPIYSPYNTVGNSGLTMFNGYTQVLNGDGGLELQASQNPVQLNADRDYSGTVWSSTGNLQIDYALHFLPELHFNLNLGYQVSKNSTETIVAPNSSMAWRNVDLLTMGAPGAGTRSEWYELQRNTLLDFYINYRKEFEAIRSNLDVMAGYSWQRFDYHGRSQNYLNTMGFITSNDEDSKGQIIYDKATDTYTLDWNQATADMIGQPVADKPMDRWANPLQLVSFFGRVNYSFDDTYLLTATLRDDGTSRFSKNNRWGLFPAVALGWKILNMPFMEKAQSVMNDFKLRLGWGVTGQQDLGGSYFPYMATYTISDKVGFLYPGYNGGWIAPINPNAYDENIKWEETTTWNVGLDLAFLNNRITAALDWYLRNTKDLLAYTPVAGVNVANYMNRNIGSLRNIGVEGTITARPVVTKEFTWTTALNVAWNKNKITALTGDAETSQIKSRDTPGGTGTGLQYHLVGQPANSYLVFQQVYDSNGDPLPGQYVDQNADGIIDDKDKIIYHSPDPKVTMTWNNTFNWRNWDLGIVLRANIGNYVYNGPLYDRNRLSAVSGYQLNNIIRDEYVFPAFVKNEQLILSDYYVENASFVRCDNITLGYTFDNLLNNNLRLRLFGAVQNPFVITGYRGLDPEIFDGIDNNRYPRPVTATLGLVATF